LCAYSLNGTYKIYTGYSEKSIATKTKNFENTQVTMVFHPSVLTQSPEESKYGKYSGAN
jgi:hypothetical protein